MFLAIAAYSSGFIKHIRGEVELSVIRGCFREPNLSAARTRVDVCGDMLTFLARRRDWKRDLSHSRFEHMTS